MNWHSLSVSPLELRIQTTLQSGQAFRWISISPGTWMCVLQGHVISLKETSTDVLFQSNSDPKEILQLLRNYFQLSTSLADLYQQWSARDLNFSQRSARLPGLRILR